MIIPINEKWRITGDYHNWVAEEIQISERKEDHPTGKWKKGDKYESYKPHYFPKLEQCCNFIIDKCPKAEETLGDVVRAIYDSRDDILKAIYTVDREALAEAKRKQLKKHEGWGVK